MPQGEPLGSSRRIWLVSKNETQGVDGPVKPGHDGLFQLRHLDGVMASASDALHRVAPLDCRVGRGASSQ